MKKLLILVLSIGMIFLTSAGHSEPLTIVVSVGTTGPYNTTARIFARHMPKYLDGHPNSIVKNMPGGASVVATNYMYSIAPKDGTVIGTINNMIPLFQNLTPEPIKFDSRKFNWIGGTGSQTAILYSWESSPIKKFDDLKHRETPIGATGSWSSQAMYATALNSALNTKFKIIAGYKELSEVELALQRGEVEASTSSHFNIVSEHKDWIDNKRITILGQIGTKKDKDISAVFLLDLVSDQENREFLELIFTPISLGCPYLLPPDVPREIVETMREAFRKTMVDGDYIKDSTRAGIPVNYMDPIEVERIVNKIVNTKSSKAKDMMR